MGRRGRKKKPISSTLSFYSERSPLVMWGEGVCGEIRELLFGVAGAQNKDPEATKNSLANKIPHLIGGFNMPRMPRIGIRQILFSDLEMYSFILFLAPLVLFPFDKFISNISHFFSPPPSSGT
ncbi:hypothetical protein AVEN_204519-1 [Araneus ventricosus]|uniref:Uncharacterized protein n=1 Tax=Araneus ventricosus TaxID=182803 RepID=A0A4Y1ZP10_ARAVE|nr:hypothetical protein AVEN_131775-1 [Araneus ventricosus]GBL60026.1 hypothetical protein AVEN_204519-1 [Araneus ventricosus]